MSNVKLAIRVRPFSERELKSEKDKTPVVCVLDENTVTITNTKVSLSGAGDSRERVRRYHCDYAFDSSCSVNDSKYASQDKVFERLGRAVLAAVDGGSSACVLAYGQSATGKTHTMMGGEQQPGLVPRLCAVLADQYHDLTVSFLEIYNERVHDLLAGGGEEGRDCSSLPRRRGNSRKDLRVREHPTRGPYVQNLRRVVVRDRESLLGLVREGARRRRTAATRRNPASSRSHALLELVTPRATLHLADLAGSEKSSWEGCGGGRQKEGANINKSLVALSNVISALVNSGLGRERFVPYRDSSLTWLLKDCFTGGAAAFIIATVSPSATCYGESASTLRWASRARRLPAPSARRAHVAPTRALLQAQLAELLAVLSLHNIQYVPETRKLIIDKAELFQSNNACRTCMNKMDEKKIININVSKSESTPSSVASGSSEKIFSNEKIEIAGDVDNLFGPSLERTRSGSEINITTPLRNKRRQYRSQEVLPVNKERTKPNSIANLELSSENICESLAKEESVTGRNDSLSDSKTVVHVPLFYDNQRAEIVSSVTERLYSKLKKKEATVASKMESIVDRKIMEPLNELRICTNARQKLVDISQKALKNKRRIGIPAYTQTRPRITRVREQGTDAQSDLEFYTVKESNPYKIYHSVATETIPLTPRCKEIAVGSKHGYLYHQEKSVATNTRLVSYKNRGIMTDELIKFECSTQTHAIPLTRRKRCSKRNADTDFDSCRCEEEASFTPIVSINISQEYHDTSDATSESDDASDASLKNAPKVVPPDLLTNHSTENKFSENEIELSNNHDHRANNSSDSITHRKVLTPIEDFPDFEERSLPRVKLSSEMDGKRHFQNIIMGRNSQVYPYNIVLSPSHEKNYCFKKNVKFEDETLDTTHVAVQTQCNPIDFSSIRKAESESDQSQSEKGNISSESIKSSKSELDEFVWKSGNNSTIETLLHNKSTDLLDRHRVGLAEYHRGLRNQSERRKERAKLYKEFLGLKREISSLSNDNQTRIFTSCESTSADEKNEAVKDFERKRQYFEDKIKRYSDQEHLLYDIESDIMKSCDRLETAVDKYDSFMIDIGLRTARAGHLRKRPYRSDIGSHGRTPREYLRHLVQVRRNVVTREADNP